tara:strand:+ start:10228 stop:11112 length:885 start_codon:yes stop_codon:yes gene_type:complete
MTFVNNLIIKKNVVPLKSNILMLNILNNTNTNSNNSVFYNPIIGSNLGIPLNLLQYIYINTYYRENLITPKLIALQFAIGIFTYGSDRLIDALQYSNTSNYSIDKINYYNYLKKTKDFNIFIIALSYVYIISLLINNPETYPILFLLTSTLGYKKIKKNYGQFKALYIGIFWTLGTVILPSVLLSHNYDILKEPTIILPSIFNLFASSNLLDIKDVNEDKAEEIYTLPVIYGSNFAITISHISIILAILLFYNNENFDNNIYLSLLYEGQSFGGFFLNFNNSNTNNSNSNNSNN